MIFCRNEEKKMYCIYGNNRTLFRNFDVLIKLFAQTTSLDIFFPKFYAEFSGESDFWVSARTLDLGRREISIGLPRRKTPFELSAAA